MQTKQIKELRLGEFFTLKPQEEPKDSQVYVRGEYDRSSRTYSACKWSDVNYERFFKPTRTVFVGFTF